MKPYPLAKRHMVAIALVEGSSPEEAAMRTGVSTSTAARIRRELRQFAPPHPYIPAWGKAPPGKQVYWTRERVLEGLRSAAAELDPLPTSSDAYNRLKKGRMDWPTAGKVLEYFGGMARGWLAAGVSRRRVQLTNSDWTAAEDEYLLTMAGTIRLMDIACALNRSYQAVRGRIGSKGFGLRARQNQGYLTAAEMAKEYGCSYHRLLELLAKGIIKGRYRPKLHRWEIDPADVRDEIVSLLREPRRTHKTTPLDVGDYYRRYGIRRSCRNPAHIMSANPPERSQHGKSKGNTEEGPPAAL